MFIVKVTYHSEELADKYRDVHRAYLDSLYAKNLLLVSGPQNPRVGGIIVALCDSREILDQILQNDPFYINNVGTFEITRFTPVQSNPQIQQLIEINSLKQD